MHSVWSAKNKDAYRFDLNPAALACTCKGFRMTSICSHVLAGTVLLQNELDTEGTRQTFPGELGGEAGDD